MDELTDQERATRLKALNALLRPECARPCKPTGDLY